MAERRLTDAAVQRIKPPTPGPGGSVRQDDHWDRLDGGGSLGLRVSSNGVRSWVIAPRVLVGGQRLKVRVTLGRYPGMSLAEARERAREAFVVAGQGKDPRELVTRARQALVDVSRGTFGVLADEFLAKHADRKLRVTTAKEYRRALKGEHAAHWQERPIGQITKRDVLDVLEPIADEHPIWANRLLAYLRKFFGWCAERDIIEAVPTDRVRPPARNTKRERALTGEEVAEVWAAIEEYGESFGALLKVLLLTGQRREEVAGMLWEELRGLEGDEPAWELPGSRTKNHLPHVVPLAPIVAAILRAVPRVVGSPHVFTTGRGHLCGFSRAKRRLDEIIAARRAKAKVPGVLAPWVVHDMRRTVSTRMHEDLGIAPHIVEAVLNHVSGARAGVAGTYNRALYVDDKRRALVAWANHVERLVSGASAAAIVVPLRQAAGRGNA